MSINATLIAQLITFGLFVWFTMRYVWPPLNKALEERQTKIADGLAAAERGHRNLELAQERIKDELREAKASSMQIIDNANRRADQIIDNAKFQARTEGERLLQQAREEIAQEVQRAKLELRQQVGALAIYGAEQIIGRQIDAAANSDIIDKLINEIE